MTFADKLDLSPRITPTDVHALLTEPKVTRRDVARAYALMISENRNNPPNVAALNRAIIDQWSAYGLDWIKREAWAIVEGRR